MGKVSSYTSVAEVQDDDLFYVAAANGSSGYLDRSVAGDVAKKQFGAAYATAGDPTAADDEGDGFRAGSLWLNTSDGGVFICEEATAGYAVWTEFATVASSLTQSDVIQPIIVACSDETSDLTTGTAKATFRMPFAFTLTAVRASVTTAPTGAAISIGINENGVSILSTDLTIDATEKTSTTAATPAVISDTSLADDAEITIDIDQVGSTIAGAGLKVALIGYRTV